MEIPVNLPYFVDIDPTRRKWFKNQIACQYYVLTIKNYWLLKLTFRLVIAQNNFVNSDKLILKVSLTCIIHKNKLLILLCHSAFYRELQNKCSFIYFCQRCINFGTSASLQKLRSKQLHLQLSTPCICTKLDAWIMQAK